MNSYVNYRYRDFQNQSFQNEFRKGEDKTADFTGARLKGCDFRGTGLTGADFSETAIAKDEKKLPKAMHQYVSAYHFGNSSRISSLVPRSIRAYSLWW